MLSSDLAASPESATMVFALAQHGQGNFASGPSVTVRFRKKGRRPGRSRNEAAYDRVGLPKGRGVYVARPVLDSAGVWQVEARTRASGSRSRSR